MSQPYRRVRKRRSSRSIFRRRIRRAAAAVACLAIAGTAILWLSYRLPSSWGASSNDNSEWEQGDLSQNLAALAATAVIPPVPLPQRVVYPYSIVPGGIQAGEELREISEKDPVVGRHYAGFDFRNAHVIELQEATLVYLSYRVGNRIFWTKHRVSLHKGEKLITDGKITARTRCANQISPVAVEAISPEEPPTEKFEEPIAMASSAMQLPFPEAVLPQGPETVTPIPPFAGGMFPPLFPPGVPIAVCPPTKKKPTKNGPCSKPVPPSPVPEPGTIALVVTGLAGMCLLIRKSGAAKSSPSKFC